MASLKAKAVADFGSLPEMEGYYKPLHFRAGDLLEIVSKEPGGGWWTGRIDGKQVMHCPSNPGGVTVSNSIALTPPGLWCARRGLFRRIS